MPQSAGPEVLRFKGKLVRHPVKTDSGALIHFSEAVGKKFTGMTKLEGTINGQPFRAELERNTSGNPSLRVNNAMLRGARANLGDTVQLVVLGPEPQLSVPADLRVALTASTEATALWKVLEPVCRRDYVRWIELAKTPGTRARRVTRTVEQLAEGKRRPCCVNAYEFMLRCIDET